jgi:hypothetical protein
MTSADRDEDAIGAADKARCRRWRVSKIPGCIQGVARTTSLAMRKETTRGTWRLRVKPVRRVTQLRWKIVTSTPNTISG